MISKNPKPQPDNNESQDKQASPDLGSSSVSASHPGESNENSRRKFLQLTMGGAVAGLVSAAGMEFLNPAPALAQSQLTPEEALKELIEGNKRFVAGCLTSFKENLAILRNHTSELQQPFAAVLACADSRVPVELIFDQTIGHIFVTRVAGNFVTPEIIGSLEYGALVLGTKVILVMGHGSCGAVKATIDNSDVPGQITSLYQHIQPAVDKAGTDLEFAIKVNARIQTGLLRQASTVIARMLDQGKIIVLPAYYHLGSGKVTLLE